jgi:hypothetical protein
MEMTAVYVEQVIIGLFVIVTVSVLLCGTPLVVPDNNAALAALIAAAYVVGILYDRISDTMLTSVAAFGKIAYGVRGKKPRFPAEKQYILDDPIPEYDQRLITTPPSQLYVLSRLRLLRALTSLIPAMTAALCIAGTRNPRFLGYVIAGYALYAALAYYWRVPQTNHISEVNVFLRRYMRLNRRGEMNVSLWRLLSYPPVFCVIAAGAIAAIRFPDKGVFIIGGLLLTFLTGWAWLRVADTHMRLVRTVAKHKVTD